MEQISVLTNIRTYFDGLQYNIEILLVKFVNTLAWLIVNLTWQTVVLMTILLLLKPIKLALSNIDNFSAGTIQVRFRKNLERQGFNKEQLSLIKALNQKELDLFLLVSFSNDSNFSYCTGVKVSSKEFHEAMIKLEKAGLITIKSGSAEGEHKIHDTTPIGDRLRALIIDATTELVNQE